MKPPAGIEDLVAPGTHGALLSDGLASAEPGRSVGIDPREESTGPQHRPLQGLRLAVKDVFDMSGLRTGAGNLAWRDEQPPAHATATAVRLLLEAGAEWIGKTVTDELTYSLAGINVHYGTPQNPKSPDRLPGGSSSGSAVAVSAGLADIALGTDCGGSIRLPASYCGIWGMRPTHGRISSSGTLALAPSFDTVGWFARKGSDLARVLEVLAHTEVRPLTARPTLLVPRDALRLLDTAVADRFSLLLQQIGGAFEVVHLPENALDLPQWAKAFRALQASEVHQQFGHWFSGHSGAFGPDVRLRFEAAAQVSAADVANAQQNRRDAIHRLTALLPQDHFMLLPTVPTPAPLLSDPSEQVDAARFRSQHVLCMAGLASLPQVSLPWTAVEGAPVGLSLIGGRGTDEPLLQLALDVHAGISSRD